MIPHEQVKAVTAHRLVATGVEFLDRHRFALYGSGILPVQMLMTPQFAWRTVHAVRPHCICKFRRRIMTDAERFRPGGQP